MHQNTITNALITSEGFSGCLAGTLGLIQIPSFGAASAVETPIGDAISIGLNGLGREIPALELLNVGGESTVERGTSGNLSWARNDDWQLTWAVIEDARIDSLERQTQQTYQSLLTEVANCPHQRLARFWNYLPNINTGDGDREIYRRFCVGRHDAFTSFGVAKNDFPAASAVGHYQQGMTIMALSCSAQVEHIGNPRQVEAFDYPRKYGPSSPSFARATKVTIAEQECYFISGTASILGHESVHSDDLRLQLYTTSDNIRYLLSEAGFEREDIQMLRVYLRNAESHKECDQVLQELFPDTEKLYLHADICRAELLVEIECICLKPLPERT